MADSEPDSLVLRYLRRLDQRTERMESDLAEVKSILAGHRQHMGGFMATDAAHESAISAIQARLDRIERRLDLVDG